MDKTLITDTPIAATPSADPLNTTAYPVIAAISFSHLLNDMMQSVLLAIYPLLKLGLDLSFTQIGLITLTYQFTGSLLQPPIWNRDWAKPGWLPAAMRATREDSGWKTDEPMPISMADSSTAPKLPACDRESKPIRVKPMPRGSEYGMGLRSV